MINPIYFTVGQRIRSLREQQRMSRKQLALVSGLGEAYINKVEHGTRRITLESISQITTALSLTLSEFFQGL